MLIIIVHPFFPKVGSSCSRRFDQSLSVKKKWRTHCGLWYDTQNCWKVGQQLTEIIFKEKLFTKDLKNKKNRLKK